MAAVAKKWHHRHGGGGNGISGDVIIGSVSVSSSENSVAVTASAA